MDGAVDADLIVTDAKPDLADTNRDLAPNDRKNGV